MRKQNKNILLSVCSALAAITMISGAGIMSQSAMAAETPSTFEMIYGAGIRVSEPTGIRFKAKMGVEYYNQLLAGTDNAQLHFVLVPYAMYKAYQADTAKGDTALYPWLVSKYTASGIVDVSVPTEKLYTIKENGETYYCANGVLSNVYFNNYHLNFVGVAYIQRGTAGNYTYQDVTGITDEENARSVFEVACKASQNEEDYAKYKTFLDTTVEKGMYRAYGVSCQQTVDTDGEKSTESYTYDGTTYATYEEMKAGVGISIADTVVTIDGETITIGGGSQQQLDASVAFSDGTEYTKDAHYTWSSSNEGVVSIDENGVITANSLGSATITVSAIGGRFTDTCTVNVTKGGTVNLDYTFLAKGDAGVAVTNTGNATVDLTDLGIVGTTISKVLCNGTEVTVAGKTENSVTLVDAPAGTQEYTFQTTVADYVVDGCVYNQGISTKDEFLAWQTAAAVGTGKCYTVLLDDIDLEGATLATPTTYYYGTFDGMGYTVSDFTFTKGVIWMMYPSVMQNAQFTEAVQDCSFAGTGVVQHGFFGQVIRGTVQNVKVSTTTTNVGNVHRSVIMFGLNNGNTAGAPGVLQNVIMEVTPQTDFAHYAYQAQATTEGLSSIDCVYMYFTNNATGGFDIWGGGGAYTNSGWYASKAEMLSKVDFSTWGEPWHIGADGVPCLGVKAIEPSAPLSTIEVAGEFLAKGDAGTNVTNTGNATFDFSATGYDFSKTAQVLCNGDAVALAGKTATSVTVMNAPAGMQEYTIITDTAKYVLNGCVYNQGISTKDEFLAWQASIAVTNSEKCYTVLLEDINLEGATLATPVEYYRAATFDGMGHTVSNFTYTKGILWMYANSVVKNVQFMDAVQDCSFAGTSVVQWGVFGNNLRGTVQNVKVSVSTTNVGNVHRGVIVNVLNNGNTAGVAGILQNVIVEVTPQTDFEHYAYQAQATTEGLSSIDNVHMYFTNNGAGGFDIWGGGGAYTNSGWYASKAEMLSKVDFSTWGEPWRIGDDGVPCLGKAPEEITVAISGVLNAPAFGREDSTKTGEATVDFNGTGYVLGRVTAVKCGTTPIEFTVNGNVLTLIDAPKGEKVYTIYTIGTKYIVTIKVYILEKEKVTVADTLYAKGDGGIAQNAPTGNATLDFSGSEVSLSNVLSVTYGNGTAASYSISGNVLTLNNAPAGDETYQIVTKTHIYTVNICVYVQSISNAEEFEAYRTHGANWAYTILLNDIDFNGATLAATSAWLRGTFDGRGHTLYNVTLASSMFGNIYQNTGAIKNLRVDATQDCTNIVSAAHNAVRNGVLAQTCNGTVENVYIRVKLINLPETVDHWGVVVYNMGATGTIKNVVACIEETSSTAKHMAVNATAGTVDNVYLVHDGVGTATDYAAATNTGIYASETAMALRVDFTGWPFPWETVNGIPYIGEPVAIERQTVTVANEFFAQGDAGKTSQNTGNATVDFSGSEVVLGTVQAVTYGEENTAVEYTANGNALTLVNAPAGTYTYTIVTNVHTYIADICVYGRGISTAEEFIAWRNETGDGTNSFWAYTVLLNDIDLKGAQLGAVSGYMRGWLDGRGHTIANFTLPSTVTGLLPRIYSQGGVKNLQIVNVLQDCSSATNHVTTSIIAQMADGTIENVLIIGETKIPSGYQHRGVITYGATATAKVQNVILKLESNGTMSHYAVGVNSAAGVKIDNVYMVAGVNAVVCQDTLNPTNTGVYTSDTKMMAAVDFSAWEKPWVIAGGKLPYMRDYSKFLGFIHEEYVGAASYTLVKDGASDYKVLMSSETYEELWTPYIDLRTYLAEATGVTLSWAQDQYASNYNASAKFISLGNTAALSNAGIVVDYDLLGPEGYQIITLGDDIYVCGSNQGISNAIYDLLHRLVGLEVYTATRYVINTVSEVTFNDLAITEVPDIEYRMPVNGEMAQYTTETNTARRALRLGQFDQVLVDGGNAHNMTTTIVPYESNSAQTNWFYKSGEQLCYTAHGNAASYNALVAEAVKNIKALLLADTDSNLLSLTQMDEKTWCNCSACTALKTKYGTDAASQILFVNDVTDIINEWLETEQGGREVQFAIFAYYTTKTAPATQNADGTWTAMDSSVILNDNVSVWIAPIEDDFRINVNQASSNNMRTMIESWTACTSSYFLWAYDAYFNNYMIPYDTYDAIQDMIRFCAEYNTKLFFVNGAWDLTQNTAFGDVKEYLYAKLMWNCNLDVNTLINNFFADVYKEAGDTMKTLFNNWRAKSATFGGNIYSSSDSWYEIYRTFDNTWLRTQLGLLETAISQISAYKTSNEALYTAIYDSIVAESISLRYLYKQKNYSEYSSSAWGSLADDAARLGVNKVSEHTDF